MDLAKYLDAIKLAKMHVAMHAGDLHARSQLAHSAAATLDLELHGTHVCGMHVRRSRWNIPCSVPLCLASLCTVDSSSSWPVDMNFV